MDEKKLEKKKKGGLSTESYKGVRDFYPEDMFVQNHIFEVMRYSAESFGFVEYGASLLEPTALYESKTGEEIVNEQTYTFTDRGGRSVTLRPEMTPTVARMVAAKRRELAFPLRWYSLPNVFRYERPQRGRLREHWQLNVDIFGAEGIPAEVEIIVCAYQTMLNFGAKETDFEIRLSYAGLLSAVLKDTLTLSDGDTKKLTRIIDSIGKVSDTDIRKRAEEILGKEKQVHFEKLIEGGNFDAHVAHRPEFKHAHEVMKTLRTIGIAETAITFEPFLVRGFDYYTGLIFEIFDTSAYNTRALFGGGRYDNLLDIFDSPTIPAVGFGMGDVTIRDFLETHDLIPSYESPTDLLLSTVDSQTVSYAQALAQRLRKEGIAVAVNLDDARVGSQLTVAGKQGIRFAICIGEREVATKKYTIKNLETKKETGLKENGIAEFIFNSEL